MTTGERIQHYRKSLGLSQEQLGNKLLVSRQTISQWEQNQSVPTVENLIRLKEIFGVSVDGILFDDTIGVNTEKPLEEYSFSYSQDELKEINRLTSGKPILQIILSVAIIVLGAVLYFTTGYIPLFSFCAGALVIHVLYNVMVSRMRKSQFKKTCDKFAGLEQRCRVYENGFTLEDEKNGEKVGFERYRYSEIEKIREVGDYFLILNINRYHIIRKSTIGESSQLYKELSLIKSRSEFKPAPRKLRDISMLLLSLTLVSAIAAPLCTLLVNPDVPLAYSSLWVFFLFLPVPAALICVGLYLRAKRYLYLKYLAIGAVTLVYLASMGCFYFSGAPATADPNEINREYLSAVAEDFDMKLPDAAFINQISFNDMEQSEDAWLYSVLTAQYEDNQKEKIKAEFKKHSIEVISEKLTVVEPPFCIPESYDAVILRNDTDETFNSLPKNKGENEYTCLFYSDEDNMITVFTYAVFW